MGNAQSQSRGERQLIQMRPTTEQPADLLESAEHEHDILSRRRTYSSRSFLPISRQSGIYDSIGRRPIRSTNEHAQSGYNSTSDTPVEEQAHQDDATPAGDEHDTVRRRSRPTRRFLPNARYSSIYGSFRRSIRSLDDVVPGPSERTVTAEPQATSDRSTSTAFPVELPATSTESHSNQEVHVLAATDHPDQTVADRSVRLAHGRQSGSRYSGIYDSIRRSIRSIDEIMPSASDLSAVVEPEELSVEHERNGAQNVLTRALSQRSPTAMSRLGSRVLPDSVMRGLLSSGEETEEEGEALRRGSSSRRRPSVFERRPISAHNERFSLRRALRRRSEQGIDPRSRPVRGPFSLRTGEHYRLHNDQDSQQQMSEPHIIPISETGPVRPALSRRARFGRARSSIASPLSGLFSASHNRLGPRLQRSPTPHPGRVSSAMDTNNLLPPISGLGRRRDRDNTLHELDAVEPETHSLLSASRITSGMTSIRRFPHGLRSRSARLVRRGEHPPLSQVLQLAATAIAAQLSGNPAAAPDAPGSFRGEAFDGSIQNFVQTLQDAATAQAGEDFDINATGGDLPPVNFMRVFQFPNDENGTPMPQTNAHVSNNVDSDMLNGNTPSQGPSDRSVTLVLVGVRSMPNMHDGSGTETGLLGPSLDTLLSLPFLPPVNVLRNGSSGALFRRSDARTRSGRGQSTSNINIQAQQEAQRPQRPGFTYQRGTADQPWPDSNHNISASVADSPPGPHPPPSTPADLRSGHVTPIRRPSSSSGAHVAELPDLEEDGTPGTASESTPAPYITPRQRRRSDSEFARRPELGSGAARRNGVVEPDRPPIGAGRSWLIYVVGTNVSSDHPAFTMPSLFTDNPTYEDMQMLSALLGPAKPPVATQHDINSAGGTFRLEIRDGVLGAWPSPPDTIAPIGITRDERCLICLSPYEAEEEVRQLRDCRHLFHRECIDEWLTTGRNSCPMCRGQGVKESGSTSPPPTAAAEPGETSRS